MRVKGVISLDINGENPMEIAPTDCNPGDTWLDKSNGKVWVRADPTVDPYGGWREEDDDV